MGAAIATKGRRRTPATASVGADPSAAGESSEPRDASGTGGSSGPVDSSEPSKSSESVETSESADSTERVTMWMDRATVVLIGAVFATTAVFDGKDIADPARLIGVGAGVLAAILRVPMLLAVVIGMAVCALIRTTGIL
ncbi:Branched-chain amino acid transport protein (AzlD) [Brevibacterium siliguriense]|uniref:Branched-chain amino acid transport protein (AzlD) n=1 Tax=Brevibacterium siliguriense TaxID=1136497 RepID=A0A1H1PPG7_9MICO|nr:AzlD domain-containing protein [Brevibacterium siliguriense]SDS13020.1 Branched-chain amino acid transport protein (AzlD) [Brevibacterium siliguriense]